MCRAIRVCSYYIGLLLLMGRVVLFVLCSFNGSIVDGPEHVVRKLFNHKQNVLKCIIFSECYVLLGIKAMK